jgi:hypothetical protein
MNSREQITERSLYPLIIKLFNSTGARYNLKISGVQEVSTGGTFPDILIYINDHKVLVQVKIDGVSKLLEDLAKTYPVVKNIGAGLLLLLLPPNVKEIPPSELESVAPSLKVARALILTGWASEHIENVALSKVVDNLVGSLLEYIEVGVPKVNYLTVAQVAREVVEELSSILRRYVGIQTYLDQAQAIIGRFDLYKSMLSEFVEKDEVMKIYTADIIAYILVLGLLFAHLASTKRHGRSALPHLANPFDSPKNLFNELENVLNSKIYQEYSFILEPLLYILKLLINLDNEKTRMLIARYLYAIQVLKPEHVREELLGRVYQEGLPPDTRKNLGAFFTKPIAAKLLAYLAVDKWDGRVLDPACGSGTLLSSCYEAKIEKALTKNIDKSDAHIKFLSEHLTGIDVMQFAKELTQINLTLRGIEIPVEPKVFWGDGIEKMVAAIPGSVDDPPTELPLTTWLRKSMEKYSELQLEKEGYDHVIMNPPFTRRERIPPSEREKLDKILGNIVKGKVGYWAYFFAASDNVIKPGGKLASVTPEEFFGGGSAESIRRYLLKGEVMSKNGRWHKTLSRTYVPQIILKSSVDVAFSEGAHYRDYLLILKKYENGKKYDGNSKCIIVTLRKKLEEFMGIEKKVAENIMGVLYGDRDDDELYIRENDAYDIIVLRDVGKFIDEFIENMKPLIAFNTRDGFELFREVLYLEGLKRINELASLRDYTAQYTGKGFEEYVRRLFISKYETRTRTISFLFQSDKGSFIKVRISRTDLVFDLPKRALVYSLRTPANVNCIDITGQEEYAIIDTSGIKRDYLALAGLVNTRKTRNATYDIKTAYNEIAGNILLTRRVRLTSPNIYWLTFYSENKIIGPSSPMICAKLNVERSEYYKTLALYLNSSITLLQLIAYAVMAEGAWVTLHGDQVWSHVRIPDVTSLPREVYREAVKIFNEVAKSTNNSQPKDNLEIRAAKEN